MANWEGNEAPVKRGIAGMNVSIPGGQLLHRAYKNICKHADRWLLWHTIDEIVVEPSPETIDVNGYLTSIPALHIAFATVEDVSLHGRVGGPVRTGMHRIKWQGTGVVKLTTDSGVAAAVIPNGFTFLNPNGYIKLEIESTTPDDYIHGIDIREVGAEGETDPFYGDWVETLRGYSLLRFDPWYENEGYEGSSVDWPTRTTSAAWNYTAEPDLGFPIEDCIELCNRVGADMWFCLPAKATLAYVRGLADLVHRTLVGKCYLEYSNETFFPAATSGWPSHIWLRDQGLELALSVDDEEAQRLAVAYYADRNFREIIAWTMAHGFEREKFVFCLGGNPNDSDISELTQQLAFERVAGAPLTDVLEVLNTSFYFGTTDDIGTMEAIVAAYGTDEDLFLDDWIAPLVQMWLDAVTAVLDLYAATGKTVAIYEWNHYWSVDPTWQSSDDYEDYIALLTATLASARFPALLSWVLNNLRRHADGPIIYFCSAVHRGDHWLWGIKADPQDDAAAETTVKAHALPTMTAPAGTSAPQRDSVDWTRVLADLARLSTAVEELQEQLAYERARIDALAAVVVFVEDDPNSLGYRAPLGTLALDMANCKLYQATSTDGTWQEFDVVAL